MVTHKIISSVDYNYWLKHLDTQPNELTIQNSLKVPKVVKATNKKTLSKTLGTSVMNIPLSPSLLSTAATYLELYDVGTLAFYYCSLEKLFVVGPHLTQLFEAYLNWSARVETACKFMDVLYNNN